MKQHSTNLCESTRDEQRPSTNTSIMYGPPPRSATQFNVERPVLLRTRSVHSTLPKLRFYHDCNTKPPTRESWSNELVFVCVCARAHACLFVQNLASVAPYSILVICDCCVFLIKKNFPTQWGWAKCKWSEENQGGHSGDDGSLYPRLHSVAS